MFSYSRHIRIAKVSRVLEEKSCFCVTDFFKPIWIHVPHIALKKLQQTWFTVTVSFESQFLQNSSYVQQVEKTLTSISKKSPELIQGLQIEFAALENGPK